MKNLLKFGFFALAISLSVVACNSNKPAETATDSVAVDSAAVDTAAVDSTVVDSAAVDTAAVK
jgi:hypothetical protein